MDNSLCLLHLRLALVSLDEAVRQCPHPRIESLRDQLRRIILDPSDSTSRERGDRVPIDEDMYTLFSGIGLPYYQALALSGKTDKPGLRTTRARIRAVASYLGGGFLINGPSLMNIQFPSGAQVYFDRIGDIDKFSVFRFHRILHPQSTEPSVLAKLKSLACVEPGEAQALMVPWEG